MRNTLGTIFMGLGLAAVLAALTLACWNWRQARQADEAAQTVMPQLVAAISDRVNMEGMPEKTPEKTGASIKEMATAQIDGFDYIGFLSLPKLELELPVMDQWDYTRLNISPCRYNGSVFTNDLTIAAHNYPYHFGQLKNLEEGDPVLFTDVEGNAFAYTVSAVETLMPTAVDEMQSGDWELTLFTCTLGGKSRVTVRCKIVPGSVVP